MNDDERKQVKLLTKDHKYNDNPQIKGIGCTFCAMRAIINRQVTEIAELRGAPGYCPRHGPYISGWCPGCPDPTQDTTDNNETTKDGE